MGTLPTWDDVAAETLDSLDRARNDLSAARDWLRSDLRPGTVLTAEAADARADALVAIGKFKAGIDLAKNALWRTLDYGAEQ